MIDFRVPRAAGWFGLAGVLFFAIELPLWIFPGNPPQINTVLPALPGKRTLSRARLECGRVRKSPCLQQDLAAFPVLGSFGSPSESAPSLAQPPV